MVKNRLAPRRQHCRKSNIIVFPVESDRFLPQEGDAQTRHVRDSIRRMCMLLAEIGSINTLDMDMVMTAAVARHQFLTEGQTAGKRGAR